MTLRWSCRRSESKPSRPDHTGDTIYFELLHWIRNDGGTQTDWLTAGKRHIHVLHPISPKVRKFEGSGVRRFFSPKVRKLEKKG